MLTVQAPSGTQLEVPIPDSVCIYRNYFLLTSVDRQTGEDDKNDD